MNKTTFTAINTSVIIVSFAVILYIGKLLIIIFKFSSFNSCQLPLKSAVEIVSACSKLLFPQQNG